MAPDGNGGGKDHQRRVVDGALFVARGQILPPFEPIDAALDDIAPRVDRPVEGQGTPAPRATTARVVGGHR